jgi:hypothetical protein
MKRKPKYLNWLKILFFFITSIFCFYLLFYRVYPQSLPRFQDEEDEVQVTLENAKNISREESELYKVIPGEPILREDEQFKQEIEILKGKKEVVEQDVKKLKEEHTYWANANFRLQEEIRKIVERTKWFDMLISASIGALVSALLTYIFSHPQFKKRMDNFLWEQNIESQKRKEEG